MKLRHFRDAVAIAEHGSLRAAARHLGIAQPTLTRGLSDLERELGAPLFERRSRGMLPTPLGEAFVRRATAILNDVRRAGDEFEQLRGNAVGSVTVGLSIAAHLWLLPKVLEPFRRKFPKVHLHIIEGFFRPSNKDFVMVQSISMSVLIRGRNYRGLSRRGFCCLEGARSCADQNIRLRTQRRSRN